MWSSIALHNSLYTLRAPQALESWFSCSTWVRWSKCCPLICISTRNSLVSYFITISFLSSITAHQKIEVSSPPPGHHTNSLGKPRGALTASRSRSECRTPRPWAVAQQTPVYRLPLCWSAQVNIVSPCFPPLRRPLYHRTSLWYRWWRHDEPSSVGIQYQWSYAEDLWRRGGLLDYRRSPHWLHLPKRNHVPFPCSPHVSSSLRR